MRVIGYHGRYHPDRTPSLRGAIYERDGYVCDERGEHDGVAVGTIAWSEVDATRTEPREAIDGGVWLLTGPRDAWLCDPGAHYLPAEAALDGMRRIARAARWRVLEALAREPLDGDEANAWWLQRAAQTRGDKLLAVVGLEHAGSELWREVLRAMSPAEGADPTEVHGEGRRADRTGMRARAR